MMMMWRAPLDRGNGLRFTIIAAAAFFTLVDLFAAQAILPVLAARYRAGPAVASLAVNASAVGMAVAGFAVALVGRRVEPRRTIVLALALLAIPTLLLAVAPNLAVFAALRFTQGLAMATAFGLSLSYLGARFGARDAAAAFAAYVTGNVASNLVGRLVAASVTGQFGLGINFLLFSALNVAGAILIRWALDQLPVMPKPVLQMSALSAIRLLVRDPRLAAGFAVGFCLLFAFLGVFTYVNFVLAAPPLALGMAGIGLVYLVFGPALVVTPVAGRAVAMIGSRGALWLGLSVAGAGMPALLSANLVIVLAGLALVGTGTFFAQAVATGFVAATARNERSAASGLYLASYFSGGVFGTFVLGIAFEHGGWIAVVGGVTGALVAAALFGLRFGPHGTSVRSQSKISP